MTKENSGILHKARNEPKIPDNEAQIALLTERMNRISEHLQENKDFSAHRGLMQLVGKRKDIDLPEQQRPQNYRQLIEKIGLRK